MLSLTFVSGHRAQVVTIIDSAMPRRRPQSNKPNKLYSWLALVSINKY